MYSKNIFNFLSNMLTKDKEKTFDLEQEDDILAGTWMTRNGEIVHEALKKAREKAQNPSSPETTTPSKEGGQD